MLATFKVTDDKPVNQDLRLSSFILSFSNWSNVLIGFLFRLFPITAV